MPVPTSLNDLSTTPASNFPAGSDAPSVLDDTLRAHAALMAQLRDRDSAFALTLLDDATASDALTTLGVSAFAKTLIDDADASTARTTLGLPNSGPLAGLRNLVINGNFAINQRGYVSGTATGGANQYTLDRWRVVTSGQNATFTASGNGNLVTAPAGGLEQVIEGLSIAGGTYVINWTGTATCTVGGTARTKGATFTLTANTNVTIRFSSGTVGEVQVEPGSVVTPFEARPYGVELALCQRYLPVLESSGVGSLAAGYTTSTSAGIVLLPLRVKPRVAPTGLSLNFATSNYGFQTSAAQSAAFIGLTFVNGSFDYVRASFSVASAVFSANLPGDLYTGAGEFKIFFTGCEL